MYKTVGRSIGRSTDQLEEKNGLRQIIQMTRNEKQPKGFAFYSVIPNQEGNTPKGFSHTTRYFQPGEGEKV